MPVRVPDYLKDQYKLGTKQVKGRFAIPSGIRCVRGSTISKCFEELPSVGVITTKSTSIAPKEGYREPIYARFSFGSYFNAVGLSNPGAERFLEELKRLTVPAEKFLLVSIFGSTVSDFRAAAEILAPVADGFELNLSCPHASGYGIEIGQDVPLCSAITRAVVDSGQRPVFAKLSAGLARIGETAKMLLESGAYGLTVANAVGPATVFVGESPVLHNAFGGLSGNAIRPLALIALQTIRRAVGPQPFIIGMGGIGTAEHVRQFRLAGADVYGVGSALTGLDSEAMVTFFADLENDFTNGVHTLGTESPDTGATMSYHRAHLTDRKVYSEGLFEIRLDSLPGEPHYGDLAGRYYFLFIPEAGEKPFAVFSARDRSVIVREVGKFTSHLARMPIGSEILVRGPYGRRVTHFPGVDRYILVGGGTGTASLLEIANQLRGRGRLQFILGARTASQIFGVDQFQAFGPVDITTDDGSLGHAGRPSDFLKTILEQIPARDADRTMVINCGPEPMIEACIGISRQYLRDSRIINAIEYPTSCGVGICGKCASPKGLLTCIDGPFLPADAFDS